MAVVAMLLCASLASALKFAQAQQQEPILSAETTAKIIKIFNNLQQSNFKGIQWTHGVAKNLISKKVPLGKDAFPDGYQYDALIVLGSIPRPLLKDPNQADRFFIQRTGGFIGGVDLSNAIDMKTGQVIKSAGAGSQNGPGPILPKNHAVKVMKNAQSLAEKLASSK
jgi:hypothetical protein